MKDVFKMKQTLNEYYVNNAKKLRQVVDEILSRFGGLSDKDYDDFYSLANEVFVDAMNRYDKSQPFIKFLYKCLSNKIKSEMTKRNRYKRMCDRMSISLDMIICEEGMTLGEVLPSNFDLEKETCLAEEGVNEYLFTLTDVQKQIVMMKIEHFSNAEIRKQLNLTIRQFEKLWKECQSLYRRTFT